MRPEFVSALCLLLSGCDRNPSDSPTSTSPATRPHAIAAAVQPLFDGLGNLHYPITTTSEEAQRYFDQGLMLTFAFNHAAADLAYTEAAARDPDCALCYWGSALVLGPNINAPMDAAVAPRAYELAQKASTLAAQLDRREQMLAAALT